MTLCLRTTCIWLTIQVAGQTVATPLEGCPDPARVAAHLRILRDKDWGEISAAQLVEIWPMNIAGTECEAGVVCAVITNEERVIKNVLQCGEIFHFEIKRDAAGKPKDQLHRITVRYSAATRADVVSAAKAFSAGAGLAAKDTETVGNDDLHMFRWQTGAFGAEWRGIDVEFYRLDPNWQVFFSFIRRPATPKLPPAK
jgi:hypothetical protein